MQQNHVHSLADRMLRCSLKVLMIYSTAVWYLSSHQTQNNHVCHLIRKNTSSCELPHVASDVCSLLASAENVLGGWRSSTRLLPSVVPTEAGGIASWQQQQQCTKQLSLVSRFKEAAGFRQPRRFSTKCNGRTVPTIKQRGSTFTVAFCLIQ